MTDQTDKKDNGSANDRKDDKRSGICLVKPEYVNSSTHYTFAIKLQTID